jgi:hypothetical protein
LKLLRKINLEVWTEHTQRNRLFGLFDTRNVAADLLATTELRTKKNTLSTWLVERDSTNLPRVIAALAATGQKVDEVAYVIIDTRVLKAVGLDFKQTPGTSPDEQANNAWHFDLINLTARDLATVARIIADNVDQAERLFRDEVKTYIVDALVAKKLNLNKFPNMSKEDKTELKSALRESSE